MKHAKSGTHDTIKDALADIGANIREVRDLVDGMDWQRFNQVPYEGSWTLALLVRHLTKAIEAAANAMGQETAPIGRDPEQWIPELKRVFLDRNNRFDAPGFLEPEEGAYDPGTSLSDLDQAFQDLEVHTRPSEMEQTVHGFPGGPYSKVELLHLAMFHLQRHIRQLHRIMDSLEAL